MARLISDSGAGRSCLPGLPFSISAGVGFIALLGIAVMNGVVLFEPRDRLVANRSVPRIVYAR